MAGAISSVVPSESRFRPLPNRTSSSSLSSNLVIIFFKACLDVRHFRKPFNRRYSRSSVSFLSLRSSAISAYCRQNKTIVKDHILPSGLFE
ncbi:hypothetical protein AVEN_138528-1 [Araneus ventricosus]|uniref:Uncharacterized protein n=1 Tax=Araneus ventricosus TaxID=182803 RepID=A0A4Y2GJ34_ARAVE|nr:hypothetical protein AVEN_138528-1 [Araneus ventricosus]